MEVSDFIHKRPFTAAVRKLGGEAAGMGLMGYFVRKARPAR